MDTKKRRRKRDDSLEEIFPDNTYDRGRRATIKEFLIFSKLLRIVYVILLCLFIGFITPWLVNRTLQFAEESNIVPGTCHIKVGLRANCFPDITDPIEATHINESMCAERGCCYQPLNLQYGAPLCHRKIPSVHTLKVTGQQSNQTDGWLTFAYPENTEVWPSQNNTSDGNLHYKIRKVAQNHFAVHLYEESQAGETNIGSNTDLDGLKLELQRDDGRLAIRIWRTENQTSHPLIDISYGSVQITKYYSELSLLLPTSVVYGQGAGPLSFSGTSSSVNFTRKLLYNTNNMGFHNMHSVPLFIGMNKAFEYYGVYIDTNGAPVEIEAMPGLVSTNRPMLVYRSMSGTMMLHLFTGPKPKDVMRQLSLHIGLPSKMPPRWALGYHICRKTKDDFDNLKTHLTQMAHSSMPYDSDCISEALLHTAFQTNPKALSSLPHDYNSLRVNGKKFVLTQPPHVDVQSDSFSNGTFVLNSSLAVFTGQFSNMYNGDTPVTVALPDFQSIFTRPWWKHEINQLIENLGVTPEGLFLTQNYPQVKLEDKCNLSHLPFVPGNHTVGNATICPDAKHEGGIDHLRMHNKYGLDHLVETKTALPDVFMFTESSSPGVAGYGGVLGSHFVGDWAHMSNSLLEMFELSLSGSPLVSMSACGSPEIASLINITEEYADLCTRWYQLAAFMPAMHTFYGTGHPRLPYSFGAVTAKWIRRSLEQRIKMMPYMYTQMNIAIKEGLPIIRPMFMEFPNDYKTVIANSMWQQFMFGNAIMVAPILSSTEPTVDVYFPWSTWYEVWSGVSMMGTMKHETIEALIYQLPAYLRAGNIIPILDFRADSSNPALSIEQSYEKFNHSMIVALNCDLKDPRRDLVYNNCSAQGTLYEPESGATITMKATTSALSGQMTIGPEATGCPETFLDSIVVYGSQEVSDVFLSSDNGTAFNSTSWYYSEDSHRLQVQNIAHDLCSNEPLIITWDLI